MLYKPSAIVSALSGTVGSLNFVASAKRPYLRTARRIVPQNTTASFTQRAALQYLNGIWTTLASASQLAWNTLAATQRWPDRLGQVRSPTGRQFFLSHNLALLRCGQTLDTTTVPVPKDVSFWTGTSLTIPSATSALYTTLCPIFGPYAAVAIYAQTFFYPTPNIPDPLFTDAAKLPQKWRFVKYRPSATANGNTDLYPEWGVLAGATAVGQRIAVLARWIETGYFATVTHTTIKTR